MTTTTTRYYLEIDSPIGILQLRASARGLTGIYMQDHRHAPSAAAVAGLERDEERLAPASEQLAEYFAGARQAFDVPLDRDAAGGTLFQRRVWLALEGIPYGATISYGELACRIGQPAAVRAVGLANGRNPLSIIVPCHRVIGAGGALVGYGGGLERKRKLLDLEARAAASPAQATAWFGQEC